MSSHVFRDALEQLAQKLTRRDASEQLERKLAREIMEEEVARIKALDQRMLAEEELSKELTACGSSHAEAKEQAKFILDFEEYAARNS